MFLSSKSTRSLFLLSALTAALSASPARLTHAAAYTYGARQRTVNAGVLFVGSASTSIATVSDPAPYVFYVLDKRADIKPVGWTFVNPIAPTSVNAAVLNRWGATYTLNAPISADMAAYWEVPLRDTSSDQLQQYDVLYLPATGVSFTPADNEKLRRFVDSGGQLIVEYTAANGAGVLPLFTGTAWTANSGSILTPPGPTGGPFDLEPVFTQPYFLSPTDLTALQITNPTGLSGILGGISGSDYGNLFSNVLLNTLNNPLAPAVSAAQLGAGQIVASTLSLGPVISFTKVAPNAFYSTMAVPQNPLTVPSIDLKILSNMISWADTHPTENKTSHQNAAGPSAASFAPAWSFPDPAKNAPLSGAAAPAGASVWGNFVYVTDSTGVLHCFDAFPDKDLLGEGKPDNGSLPPDFTPLAPATVGTPFDEIWHATVGVSSSAPTVATFNGVPYVYVEKANGSVAQYNSITGTLVKPFALATLSAVSYPTGSLFNAPAPTFYEGRLYAGQADGTLAVFDLNPSGSASGGVAVSLTSQTGLSPAEYVTASPAVGVLAGTDNSNAVVATVATNYNMYTVLLGGRNDPLTAYTVNGQLLGYNVNRSTRYRKPNLFVDLGSVPQAYAFDTYGTILGPAFNGQDPVFSATNYGDYFANWDIDFIKSLASGGNSTLTLHMVKDVSAQSSSTTVAQTSAPAFDRAGDYYFTVNDSNGNSYLMGVHDDIQQANVRIKFRFRIPVAGEGNYYPVQLAPNWLLVDADNVDYNNVAGFHFVGAPVVDGQGNVYVAAQDTAKKNAAIFCFNGNQAPSGDAVFGYDTTQSSYTQNDEGANGQDNAVNAVAANNPTASRYAQLVGSSNHLSVVNFGKLGATITGILTEPQPFLATPSPNQNPPQIPQAIRFHTNLAWYTTFKVNGLISGLSKAGNTVMLAESGGPFTILDKFPANPTVGAGKLASIKLAQTPLGTGTGGAYLNLGTVTAAPSAGGGAMVVNGTAGIAGFNQQLTLIADNNRILEADADGNAVWSVDGTTRPLSSGTSTKVDFGHPTSLSQVAPNDYLVADTGNNRCVRFDRAGNVLWELTRFKDPSSLMAPGQPDTLNGPMSVVLSQTPYNYTDPVSLKSATGMINRYLIADSGNNRVLEVTDLVDAFGNVLYLNNSGTVVVSTAAGAVSQDHLLTWISHTADQYGRRYRYGSASYFYTGTSPVVTNIAAIVTNTRIAALATGGTLSPASADSPGGSIVYFTRPAAPVAFNPATPNTDLNYVATLFQVGTGATAKTFQVRNPRFLNVFMPPNPSSAVPYSFLYADDNGAFDLNYNFGTKTLSSTGLAFTTTDYQNMTVVGKIPTTTLAANYAGVPARTYFVPTCVQRINDDNTLLPRYLITQSYGGSELGGPPAPAPPVGQPPTQIPRIGGEIFEVDVDQTTAGAPVSTAVGGFGPGATLSRPGGTSPLTQPTSAIRTPQ